MEKTLSIYFLLPLIATQQAGIQKENVNCQKSEIFDNCVHDKRYTRHATKICQLYITDLVKAQFNPNSKHK